MSQCSHSHYPCHRLSIGGSKCRLHKPYLGDSGDGGDGSFGMPPADCRNCHPYPLHDGHDDGDGVFGILPRKSCNRHAAVLLSEAARRRIAGRSPVIRESRGNVWHTSLLARCSVLHPINAVGKIFRFF